MLDQNSFFLLVYDMLLSGFCRQHLKNSYVCKVESASLLWMIYNHVYLSTANLKN